MIRESATLMHAPIGKQDGESCRGCSDEDVDTETDCDKIPNSLSMAPSLSQLSLN